MKKTAHTYSLNLAIVSTNKDKYSETFIHNHLHHLPANIFFLFDGYLPQQYSLNKGRDCRKFITSNKSIWSFFNRTKTNNRKKLEQEIEKFLIEKKIDVILCEYGPSGVEMMMIADRLKIPLVVHFHGYDAYRNDVMNSYGNHYTELFQKAEAIIGVSKHMCSQLKLLGCPEQKLHYLPYGINTDIFIFSGKTKKPIFVACGRFVPKKAPELSIRAFAKTLAQFPQAKLIMIGDGELLLSCKELVKELNISDAIEFKGAQTQTQIAEIYSDALAFVQHSITTGENDSEGTPLAILESAASGLPCISTKHAGIPDVVIDGETGFLVNEGDVETMSTFMIKYLENPHLAKLMGEKAAAHAISNFTLSQYTSGLLQILINSNK